MAALPFPVWWLGHQLLKVLIFLASPVLLNFIGSCVIDTGMDLSVSFIGDFKNLEMAYDT